jgi:dethiobiotin synthetase
MPMSRIIILGSGTDVGKTYATTQLARSLATLPTTESVTAIKPIESGIRTLHDVTAQTDDSASNRVAPWQGASDAQLLASASQPTFVPPTSAYAFSPPISPHLAARQGGQKIDFSRISSWIESIERSRTISAIYDNTLHRTPLTNGTPVRRSWLLIETAGGAFSPLGKTENNVTLAQALGPAIWILVAPDRLGVLHDLTATLQAMRTTSRMPDSIILSQRPPADASTGTNARELVALGLAEIDTVVPTNGTISAGFALKLSDLADDRGL